MTDNQPTDRPEDFPGGAAPDSGGSPIGDLYGAGAVPASATPTTGTTAPTGTAPTGTASTGSGASGSGTSDAMKEEAQHVRETAMDAGRQVAGTAKEEARHVAGEAKAQARRLLDQTMHEASAQAKAQQHRAADGMRTFGDDMRGMASGAQGGFAAQLVSEVGDRVSGAARWLDEREPADLLDEVKSFARRRPVTFIVVAGVAGLLVGRLARGIASEAKDEREQRSAGGPTRGAHAATQWDESGTPGPTTASGASATPVAVGSPYGDSALAAATPGDGATVPGGSTRGTVVDADLPAQTGHSPHGTGLPRREEDAL